MELKIEVKTPPGMAHTTLPYLKDYIIGIVRFGLKRVEAYTNEDTTDDRIYIDIDATIRRCLKVQANVVRYHTIMEAVITNKQVLRKAKLSKEDEAKLKDMLSNQTTVEIMKKVSQEEIDEFNKTRWQKIKEKFKKINLF